MHHLQAGPRQAKHAGALLQVRCQHLLAVLRQRETLPLEPQGEPYQLCILYIWQKLELHARHYVHSQNVHEYIQRASGGHKKAQCLRLARVDQGRQHTRHQDQGTGNTFQGKRIRQLSLHKRGRTQDGFSRRGLGPFVHNLEMHSEQRLLGYCFQMMMQGRGSRRTCKASLSRTPRKRGPRDTARQRSQHRTLRCRRSVHVQRSECPFYLDQERYDFHNWGSDRSGHRCYVDSPTCRCPSHQLASLLECPFPRSRMHTKVLCSLPSVQRPGHAS
mmetsp:Transcript_7697/g.15268  ORF Transcript_7697/g.15268 Transcript_7697/m.15268 type:complete len:274 (+) Transcript_7697:539-1360(+)